MDWKLISYILITNAVLISIVFLIYNIVTARKMKKKRNEMQGTVNEIKVGVKVLFAAGLIGVITSIDEEKEMIKVKIAENIVVSASRYSIVEVLD